MQAAHQRRLAATCLLFEWMVRSISQTSLHQVLEQLPRLVSPQELISTQVCEASVRTDMVLPGMYQPDRSWAEAAMDE